MIRRILISLLFVSAVCQTLHGQQTEIRFHNLSVTQGLSHSHVSVCVEDSLGFLWFGTQDGLNRYDGYGFRNYYMGDDRRTPSDSWIERLYVDSHNQIWIWYNVEGLERFDPSTDSFHRYEADSLKPGSISGTSYVSRLSLNYNNFFEDSEGTLWIGTDRGLNKYNREEDTFIPFRHDPKDPRSLSDDGIVTIAEDLRGNLWIGTSNGLNLLNRETGEVHRFISLKESESGLNDNSITFIHCHQDGSVWVGTAYGGLNIIEDPYAEDLKVHHLITQPLNPNHHPVIYNVLRTSSGEMLVATHHGLIRIYKEENGYREELIPETRGVRIFHCMEDSKGNTWVSSFHDHDKSLFRMSPDLQSIEWFSFNEWAPFVFEGKKVLCLHESRNGLIWIGTENDGVYMVDLNAQKFRTIDNYPERGLFISDKDVYSIYENEEQQLYIGTKTKVNRIDLRDSTTQHLNNRYNTKNSLTYEYSNELPANIIGVIKEQADGKIWMGSFDYKLSLYDPRTGQFLNFHINDNDPASFQIWTIRSICISSDDRVYVGGGNMGLGRLREDNHSFEYFPVVATGDPEGTNDSQIQYIYEDSDGIIWVGTMGSGLNRFDPSTGLFEHFVNDPSDKTSLSNNRIRCIFEPEIHGEDILWIGTNNGGLNRFDKKSRSFTSYTIGDGLPSNTVHGILEDDLGDLWLSTNRGLVQFDPVHGGMTIYTEEDGLIGNEFNQGAFFKNREGIIYFGGTNGVTYFHPDEIDEKPLYETPVILTSMSISGNRVLPGDTVNERVILERSISFTHEINLSNKDKFVSFDFVSLAYAAPKKVKYRYMLEGFDDGWHEVDASHRYVSYSNLPIGTYKLMIEGTNSDGNYSDHHTGVVIHVLPPFWNTTWFKLLLVAVILVLIIIIIQVRTQILNSQKLNLEKEVKAQTRDLKNANLMLGEHNDEIREMAKKLHESDQMKLRFFTNISHEFRTPLTLIMGPTEQLLNSEAINSQPADREMLEMIYRNEQRLYKLINQLLEIRTVETGNLKLAVAEDDIVSYMKSIHQLFKPYAERRGIDFRFRTQHNSILIHFDSDKIEKIFYNLLSNAFKHTPLNGSVELSMDKVEEEGIGWLKMTVADSGPGIGEKHLEHIFDRFYQITDKYQSGGASSGIGLSLCKDLVERHYGTIDVFAEEGVGTQFEVRIRVDREIYRPEEILTGYESDLDTEYIQTMLEFEHDAGQTVGDLSVDKTRYSILVVEDNLDMQKLLYNELSDLYNVFLAGNGEEGLLVSKQDMPDLIVSDYMMPEMDGLEFCQAIKNDALTSHIPFVLLTAKSGTESQISGLELGADDYITKPFNMDVLKLKLRNILESTKQLAEKFSSESDYIPENIEITQINKGFLEKLVKLVEDNIDNGELSGDLLARELGMSKGYLYKKLRSLTGLTVNLFIRSIRLKLAARLLNQGDYNITEVAYSVGFTNPKYFSTCFREMFKVTPREYQKR
ncbi:MAG: two-component regulator propeller domain-containing protein [Bacteroidota bacterium]